MHAASYLLKCGFCLLRTRGGTKNGILHLPPAHRGGTKKGLVYDLALDASGTWAVAAVQGAALLVFDVGTGQQVCLATAHTGVLPGCVHFAHHVCACRQMAGGQTLTTALVCVVTGSAGPGLGSEHPHKALLWLLTASHGQQVLLALALG